MQTDTSARPQVQNPVALAAVLCGLGVIIGSLGPWLKVTLPLVGTVTVSGTDGNRDGLFTLVAGVLAVLIMAVIAVGSRESRSLGALTVVAGLLFLIVAGVVTYDWANLQRHISDMDEDYRHLVTAGWGLYLTGLTGAAGVLASFVTYSHLQAGAGPADELPVSTHVPGALPGE